VPLALAVLVVGCTQARPKATTTTTVRPGTGAMTTTAASCASRPSRLIELAALPPAAAFGAVEDPTRRCALLVAGQAADPSGVPVRRVSISRTVEVIGSIPGAERITAMAAHKEDLWAAGADPSGAALLAESTDRGRSWRRRALPARYSVAQALAVGASGEPVAALQRDGSTDLVTIRSEDTGFKTIGRSTVVVTAMSLRDGQVLAAGASDRRSEALLRQAAGQSLAVLELPRGMSEVRAVLIEKDGTLAVGGVTRRADGTTTAILVESTDAGRTWRPSNLPAGSELLDMTGGEGGVYVVIAGPKGPSVYVRSARGSTWEALPARSGATSPDLAHLLAGRSAFWAFGDHVYVGVSAP
jgi:hypothetical protein